MATVQALGGNPGQGVDLKIAPKNANYPFIPNGNPSIKVAATTSTQTFQLPRTFKGDEVVRIYNTGTTIQRIKFGLDNTVVAIATDKAIAPGSVELMRIGVAGWVAVIGDAAGTIEFDCGFGI